MATYEQLQLNGLDEMELREEQSPSCLQVYPVNLTALQEKVSAIVTAVTSSKSLSELSASCNRGGYSLKILPVYSQGKINDTSIEYSRTYPRWGILQGGECGELVTSERHTGAKECLLWRTPTASDGEFTKRTADNLAERYLKYKQIHLSEQVAYVEKFPTPLASDAVRMRYSSESLWKVADRRITREYTAAGCNLSEYVAYYPTPQATSWGCAGARKKLENLENAGTITETERRGMSAGNGGKLNPTWVEWLQGVPLGWTDLED